MADPLGIFVLGEMKPLGNFPDDDPRFIHRTHTTQLARILAGARDDLVEKGQVPSSQEIQVETPDEADENGIVEAVLKNIENADLTVVDISNESPNVMYELGAVNALGVPYILVTDKDNAPFYLTQTRTIVNFAFLDNFDPDQPSHRELRKRLLANYQSPDNAMFRESPFSEYFHGFPIVNVSGPASLATGYHVNTLARFCAQDTGFLERKVSWASATEDPPEPASLHADIRLKAFVIVIPDPLEHTTYGQARDDFEDAMTRADLPTHSAAILEGPEKRNRLSFGALILKNHPQIVVDIPRTLFPLVQVPRVIVALQRNPAQHAQRVRSRQIRRLLREFREIIEWNLNEAQRNSGGAWGNVHIVEQRDAPAFIRTLLEQYGLEPKQP